MGILSPEPKIVRLSSHGHDIEFVNSWRIDPLEGQASLTIDGELIDSNHDLIHLNPHEPVLLIQDFSETIQKLEVFVIGVMSIKVAIKINDQVVYKDKISWLDRLQSKFFERAS